MHHPTDRIAHTHVTGTGTGICRFLCSGQGKKSGEGYKGELPALAGTREYEQSDWNR